MYRRILTVLMLAGLTSVTAATGQVPATLAFQGFLENDIGTPLDSSGVQVTFRLYKDGTSVWTETQSIDFEAGVFSASLGEVVPLDTLAFDDEMELGITLVGEGVELSPRTMLVGGAFARSLPGLLTYRVIDGLNQAINIVGGSPWNEASGFAATIGGGGGEGASDFSNTASGNWSVIGGGSKNQGPRRLHLRLAEGP